MRCCCRCLTSVYSFSCCSCPRADELLHVTDGILRWPEGAISRESVKTVQRAKTLTVSARAAWEGSCLRIGVMLLRCGRDDPFAWRAHVRAHPSDLLISCIHAVHTCPRLNSLTPISSISCVVSCVTIRHNVSPRQRHSNIHSSPSTTNQRRGDSSSDATNITEDRTTSKNI